MTSASYIHYYATLQQQHKQPMMSSTTNLTDGGVIVMDEEQQCHRPRERWNIRPPRGVREKEDYRNSGTGHEIHFEIEDVLDKKK